MDIKEHTRPYKLEKYSFIWSQTRLLIAALALFLGGLSPIFKIIPISLLGPTNYLLTLSWIISGIASAYLLYRWYSSEKTLFGGKNSLDVATFFISVVSGLNLGIAGILRINIGMSIYTNYALFVIVGILYLASAGYLYKRWNESGKALS